MACLLYWKPRRALVVAASAQNRAIIVPVPNGTKYAFSSWRFFLYMRALAVFRYLGIAIARFWPILLIGWLALFAILSVTAPSWDQVAQDREFGFLPDNAPTRQGQALFRRAFSEERQVSN